MVGCVQWKLTVPSLTPGWEFESCRGTREWAAGWQGHLGAGLGLAGAGGLTEWSSPRTSGKSAEPAPEATGCLKEMNGSGKNPASKWLIGFASVGPMNIHEVSLLTSAFSALCRLPHTPLPALTDSGPRSALIGPAALGNAIATPGWLPSNSSFSSFFP